MSFSTVAGTALSAAGAPGKPFLCLWGGVLFADSGQADQQLREAEQPHSEHARKLGHDGGRGARGTRA